jgi:hypothetical protein
LFLNVQGIIFAVFAGTLAGPSDGFSTLMTGVIIQQQTNYT